MKPEIENREDIELLVDTFYAKARKDGLIGPIFESVVEDWPTHLDKMYRFWESVLFRKRSYRGSPFVPHSVLPIGKPHFERWLTLFHETLDDHFSGNVAETARWRSIKMAEMFQLNLEHIQNRI